MKELGIHAARHEVAGAAGGALQQRAKLRIGRKQHLRDASKSARRCDMDMSSMVGRRHRQRARAAAQEPLGAARGVLVHVGMPACGQGKIERVRQAGAQHAHLAGAGDVNQVRLEARQHFFDQGNVAQDRRDRSEDLFQARTKEIRAAVRGSKHCRLHEAGSRSPARTHRKGRLRRRAKASKWRLVWATPFTSWKESGK